MLNKLKVVVGPVLASMLFLPANAGFVTVGYIDYGFATVEPYTKSYKNINTSQHKTLPFGTQLLVTNLNNGRRVMTTVIGPLNENDDNLVRLNLSSSMSIGCSSMCVVSTIATSFEEYQK